MDGGMNGWMIDEWMSRWMDGWVEGWKGSSLLAFPLSSAEQGPVSKQPSSVLLLCSRL